ncbi:hypothetical protein niasHT_027410 [Heterodera trifolii]|uniref:Uncharacterized protein n=1 Tax=Heterodera trifolii TaxID=157864 RepID=A0ABD2JTX2_9BILA
MKTHQLSSENPNDKQQKYSAEIGRKAFDIPKRVMANAITKGHLNLNGGGRKRSVEPRPHPAKLLNKRYWDDVRAGRVCPPRAMKEEEQITNNTLGQLVFVFSCGTTKQSAHSKGQYTKSGAKSGEKKRKASMPLEMAIQNAKSNANFQNSTPMMPQHRPTPGTFSPPPNRSLFPPQSLGPHFLLKMSRLCFALPLFLPPPPPQHGILRPPVPLFVPPAVDAFIPSQFAPSFDSSATAPTINAMNMNMVIPPLMMLHQQQQSNNNAERTTAAAAATWTLFEMLAKVTTPNGQQQQNEMGQQSQQNNSTNRGQQNGTTENQGPINVTYPSHSLVGCSPNLLRNSESDAQIDQLMDQMIAQRHADDTQLASDCRSPHSQLRGGECRLCFVPIPMPVPVPVPVSTDFILKHFGTMNQ